MAVKAKTLSLSFFLTESNTSQYHSSQFIYRSSKTFCARNIQAASPYNITRSIQLLARQIDLIWSLAQYSLSLLLGTNIGPITCVCVPATTLATICFRAQVSLLLGREREKEQTPSLLYSNHLNIHKATSPIGQKLFPKDTNVLT